MSFRYLKGPLIIIFLIDAPYVIRYVTGVPFLDHKSNIKGVPFLPKWYTAVSTKVVPQKR